MDKVYVAIDLKSFYASVECMERGLDPLNTNLVVADMSRTEKTICLAVSPSLKSYGISGRARLYEVVQRVEQVNNQRKWKAPGKELTVKGTLHDAGTGEVLAADGAAAEMTFTAEEYSGTADMTFTFDYTQLAGTDVVVFEEIYDGDTLIASHCDLADSAQTVHILSETVKPHKTVDKVSSAVGETRVWTVHCGVPADFHDGEGSLYMIRDVIDPEREEVAGKRLDYTGGLTLSLDGEALDPETDCAVEEPSEDNGMCLTVTFLPEGLTKLAQRASQPGNEDCIVLTYETVINENALAAEKIPNEAEVSFGRYGIVVTETTERPDVYTGEIRIRL